MKSRIAIACLLICTGLGIIFYPWLRASFFERQKNLAAEQWLDATAYDSLAESQTMESQPEEPREGILSEESDEVILSDEDVSRPYDLAYVISIMEGVMYIDSIGLRSPILPGATAKNLDFAICRLEGSTGPGESGNYCLAGHKSRIYGRHFNRLKETSIGDIITVETKQAIYNYEIVNTFAVTPEDVWVLDNDMEKKEITLVTCDYAQQPTGRFIVRGALVEEMQEP